MEFIKMYTVNSIRYSTLKMNCVLGQWRGSQLRNIISFNVKFRNESWNSPCSISPYSRCSSIKSASCRFDKIVAWGLSSFTGVESPSKNIRRTFSPGLMSENTGKYLKYSHSVKKLPGIKSVFPQVLRTAFRLANDPVSDLMTINK